MKINLKHQSGLVKQVKVGFSWTTLFFGFFVPLIRGDWKWGLIILLVSCATCGLANIVFAFIYNKQYLADMIEKGWVPADEIGINALLARGIISPEMANNYLNA